MSETVAITALLIVALAGFFYGFFYGRRLQKSASGFWQRFQWPVVSSPADRYNQTRMLLGMGVFMVAIGAMLLITTIWGPVVF